MSSFVRYADDTLGELARNDRPFAATIQQLPGTLATMSSSFAELRTAEGALDPALRSLGPVAERPPDPDSTRSARLLARRDPGAQRAAPGGAGPAPAGAGARANVASAGRRVRPRRRRARGAGAQQHHEAGRRPLLPGLHRTALNRVISLTRAGERARTTSPAPAPTSASTSPTSARRRAIPTGVSVRSATRNTEAGRDESRQSAIQDRGDRVSARRRDRDSRVLLGDRRRGRCR